MMFVYIWRVFLVLIILIKIIEEFNEILIDCVVEELIDEVEL